MKSENFRFEKYCDPNYLNDKSIEQHIYDFEAKQHIYDFNFEDEKNEHNFGNNPVDTFKRYCEEDIKYSLKSEIDKLNDICKNANNKFVYVYLKIKENSGSYSKLILEHEAEIILCCGFNEKILAKFKVGKPICKKINLNSFAIKPFLMPNKEDNINYFNIRKIMLLTESTEKLINLVLNSFEVISIDEILNITELTTINKVNIVGIDGLIKPVILNNNVLAYKNPVYQNCVCSVDKADVPEYIVFDKNLADRIEKQMKYRCEHIFAENFDFESFNEILRNRGANVFNYIIQ